MLTQHNATMEAFFETPIVRTGKTDVDRGLNLSIVIILAFASANVLSTLVSAWRKLPRRRDKTLNREIYKFLLLSLIAFLVVNGLKYEFRGVREGAYKEISAAVRKLKTEYQKKTGRKHIAEMPNG